VVNFEEYTDRPKTMMLKERKVAKVAKWHILLLSIPRFLAVVEFEGWYSSRNLRESDILKREISKIVLIPLCLNNRRTPSKSIPLCRRV